MNQNKILPPSLGQTPPVSGHKDSRVKVLLMVNIPIVLFVGVAWWYLFSRESTTSRLNIAPPERIEELTQKTPAPTLSEFEKKYYKEETYQPSKKVIVDHVYTEDSSICEKKNGSQYRIIEVDATGKKLRLIHGPEKFCGVQVMSVSPSGRYVDICRDVSVCSLTDMQTGKVVKLTSVWDAHWSSDERFLAKGDEYVGENNVVSIYNVQNANRILYVNKGKLQILGWLPDNNRLILVDPAPQHRKGGTDTYGSVGFYMLNVSRAISQINGNEQSQIVKLNNLKPCGMPELYKEYIFCVEASKTAEQPSEFKGSSYYSYKAWVVLLSQSVSQLEAVEAKQLTNYAMDSINDIAVMDDTHLLVSQYGSAYPYIVINTNTGTFQRFMFEGGAPPHFRTY